MEDSNKINDASGRGEQRTICEGCGNANLAHSRAIWTDDGSSFCPNCAPALPGEAEVVAWIRSDDLQEPPERRHVTAWEKVATSWAEGFHPCTPLVTLASLQAMQARAEKAERERDEAIGKGERQWAGWVREEVARKSAEARVKELEEERDALRSRIEDQRANFAGLQAVQDALNLILPRPKEAPMVRLTAEEERDALLSALGFLPGPFKDELTQKVILEDAAGLRPEMVRARRAEMQLQSDLDECRLIVATNLRQWVRKRFGVWITWKSAWSATDEILPSQALEAHHEQ